MTSKLLNISICVLQMAFNICSKTGEPQGSQILHTVIYRNHYALQYNSSYFYYFLQKSFVTCGLHNCHTPSSFSKGIGASTCFEGTQRQTNGNTINFSAGRDTAAGKQSSGRGYVSTDLESGTRSYKQRIDRRTWMKDGLR